MKGKTGHIDWVDITVPDAGKLRDFYAAVVGWNSTELDMGGYNDYCMNDPEDGTTVAGVCHSRGENAHLPPIWLVYINVADVEQSAKLCVELGGKLRAPIKSMGQGKYCVIEDPSGVVSALFQPTSQ